MVRDTKGNVNEQNKKIQSFYARQTRSQSSKIESIYNEGSSSTNDSNSNNNADTIDQDDVKNLVEDGAKKRKFVDYETTENLYENFGTRSFYFTRCTMLHTAFK